MKFFYPLLAMFLDLIADPEPGVLIPESSFGFYLFLITGLIAITAIILVIVFAIGNRKRKDDDQ